MHEYREIEGDLACREFDTQSFVDAPRRDPRLQDRCAVVIGTCGRVLPVEVKVLDPGA